MTTEEAEAAAEAARATVADLALDDPGRSRGRGAARLRAETVAGWISFGPRDATTTPCASMPRLPRPPWLAWSRTSIATRSAPASRSPAPGSAGSSPARTVRQLDAEAPTASALDALGAAGQGRRGPRLALAVDVTEPALTTAAPRRSCRRCR